MDKAVEYSEKLQKFVDTLNAENPGVSGDRWEVETGRKFD